MAIQERVLAAALRICRSRKGWTFRPAEVVEALPDLNAGSVRTHVMSRCCVNAPPNHPHRWPYFRRVARGVYEVLPELRRRRASVPRRDRLADPPDPVVEIYQSHVDRSAIRRNLRLTPEQRLRELQQWIDAMEEIRGVARESGPRTVR